MSRSDLKQYLNDIWFRPYRRGQRESSGFQHVFMAEIKKDTVQGLHNWLYYLRQQNKGTINYIGYMKFFDFKGYVSNRIIFLSYRY